MSRKNAVIWGCLLMLVAGVVMVAYAQELQLGDNEAGLEENMSFVEVFKKGGLLMWPISVMSILGVALIMYFIMVLRPEQIVPQAWFDELRDDLSKRKLGDARILCNQKPSPISAVTVAALDYVEDTGRPESSLLKEIMEGEGIRQATRLQNQVQYLQDIAVITPMFGLLGTVVGMVQAFNAVALDLAKAKPMLLAAGVSLALITTAAGLIVAIPAMIAYSYFRNRTASLIGRLETASADLLTQLVK